MPSPMGWAGLMLIAMALALIIRRLRRSPPPECEEPLEKRPIVWIPDAVAWCQSMEALYQGAVLCLNEALCLVAAGERGHAIACAETAREAHDPGCAHVVDIVPHEACAAILALTAEARRGDGASRLIRWGNRQAWVRAVPLGGRWIAVLIRAEQEAAA